MKHLKLIGSIVLICLILLSLGFNTYFLFQSYQTKLLNQGADLMLQNIVKNIKDNGFITITVPPDTTITLVPKEAVKK